MKREIKVLFTVFVVLFASLPTLLPAPSSALTSDDFFIYELTAASLYTEIDVNSNYYEGYYNSGEFYPLGTKINATIDSISDNSIYFRFYIENSNVANGFISSDWFDNYGLENAFTTLAYTYRMFEDYEERYLFTTCTFRFHPYIYMPSCAYLNDPNSLGNAISNTVDDWFYGEHDIECLFTFSESNGILYFESWIGGKVDRYFGENLGASNNYPSDISFGNNLHLAVNTSSSVVCGWGQRGWVKGKIHEKNVKVAMEWEHVLDGYVFPDYEFGNMRYFGNVNLYLAILIPISIPLIFMPVIIYFVRNHKINKLLKAQAEKQDDNK